MNYKIRVEKSTLLCYNVRDLSREYPKRRNIQMKLVFISAVAGVGKTTTCNYIKNNNLLENYDIFDIDDLENVNNYNNDTYNIFY